MVVIDTSAWIEWLIDSPTAIRFEPRWPAPENTIVPTLVQYELAKWLQREMSPDAFDQALAHLQTCIVLPIDTRLALLAAELSLAHKLATADALIYAAAKEHDAELLTCDAHFKDLPRVVYVAKV